MRELKTQLVVLGGGPGGYSAAFRAADLGKSVVLIERYENLGGVCLNVGCIPSKTLLHVACVLDEARQFENHGIFFGSPQIDINKLCSWKNSVIKRISVGLRGLVCKRKIELISGIGKFISANQMEVDTATERLLISFENAIIAVGSSPIKLPFIPDDPRVMDSTDALSLTKVSKDMLIVGGGIIGLEIATIYRSLGSRITVVELMAQLISGFDADIVRPLQQYNAKKIFQIFLSTKLTKVEAKSDGLWVSFEGKNAPSEPQRFDSVLVAVGRRPNGKLIGAEVAGIKVDDNGFIQVDEQMRTNVPSIFAIGDVVGNPMLAHKAVSEGKFVSEVIVGAASPHQLFGSRYIPRVAYTDPEIAIVGLSEDVAKQRGILYTKSIFPWLANGRSLSLGRQEGLTKLLFDPISKKILGGGIVGPNAGELISEVALAIELGVTAEILAKVIHPHPTLSETIMMASEVFLGTVTDL